MPGNIPDPFAPDWPNAPPWAVAHTVTSSGASVWWSHTPIIIDTRFGDRWHAPGRCRIHTTITWPHPERWRASLRLRPTQPKQETP